MPLSRCSCGHWAFGEAPLTVIPMSDFRRTTNSETQSSVGHSQTGGLARLGRFVGRLLLWGAVLLLLVRGIASYFGPPTHVVTTTRGVTVTVTQPAHTEPSAHGK